MTATLPQHQSTPGMRRVELAAFLRNRRARIAPEVVDLPRGARRRTPGLRREEVAQLAGVGVTWYTWLEQGRPINASPQVLDAIARTLRLDTTESEHLYRLADVPWAGGPALGQEPKAETLAVLEALHPTPAAIYNDRFDLLAHNAAFGALFPGLVAMPPGQRNVLWHMFVTDDPSCCTQFVDRREEMASIVAMVRTAFGRHLDDPGWAAFVRRLSSASPAFAAMWADHNVSAPGTRTKLLEHPVHGRILILAATLVPANAPDHKVVVYTPGDEASAARVRAICDTAPSVG